MVARTGKLVRVAITGAANSVFRAPDLEQALTASFTPAAARAVKVDAARLNTGPARVSRISRASDPGTDGEGGGAGVGEH